jgi:hypothetical protein
MRKIGIAFLFAAMAVMGCSSDSGGSAGSGGTAGSGGSAGSGGGGGEAGTGGGGGEGGAGGMGGDMGTGGGGGAVAGEEFAETFDSMTVSSPTALSDSPSDLWGDGWLSFAEVFDGGENLVQAYPPAAADGRPEGGTPNGGDGFAALVTMQGGEPQGVNQLSIFSDYGNRPQQEAGNRVEANTYRERSITMGDVGKTITFSFDAKRNPDSIEGASTANAFIKTLDPTDDFATTNNITEDTTSISTDWTRYEIELALTQELVGQLLQFGFVGKATNDEASAIFYDNVLVTVE